MADLYGRPPSPATEPEEISTFIHQILHNPSSSSKSTNRAFSSSSLPRPETASSPGLLDPRRFGRSGPECQGGGSSVNFSDPGGCFAKENVENAVSSVSSKRRGVSVENDAGDFSCDSEGAAEVPSDKVRPRSSSKRSRTAEVHNLSEKRRRSRINEKMKALQNLIPNSNKTDKASMLDEAIEYLKQLQLQVQMLTMRNGLSLNPPMYFPGILQPLQLPLAGLNFDEENILLNTNRVTGAFGANEENLVYTSHNILSQSNISNQPMVIPSRTKVNSPDTSFSFDSLIQVHHAPFNLSASSKEICGEGAPQRQLDTNQTVKTSSSSMP